MITESDIKAKAAALAQTQAQTDANAAAAKTGSDVKVANDAATIQEKLRSHFKSKDLVYATPYTGRTAGVAGKYPEGAEIYFPTSSFDLLTSLPNWTNHGIDKNDVDKSNCGVPGGKRFQIVFKTKAAREKLEKYVMTLAPSIVASAAAAPAPTLAAPTPAPTGILSGLMNQLLLNAGGNNDLNASSTKGLNPNPLNSLNPFANLSGNNSAADFNPFAQISTTFTSTSSSGEEATAAEAAVAALPNPLLYAQQLAKANADSKAAAAAASATQSTATVGVAANGTPPAQTAASGNKL